MKILRRTVLVALTLAGCVTAAPGVAYAQDYCVGGSPLCPTQTQTPDAAGLQAALAATNTHAGHDRVFVKAGSYNLSGGYSFTAAAGESLDIIGQGSASTRLTCAMAGPGTCFAVTTPNTTSHVQGLSVEPTGAAANVSGLILLRASGSDLAVKDPGGMSAFRGVGIYYGSLVDGCSVALASSNSIGVSTSNSPLTIRNCAITGGINSTGVYVGGMLNTYVIDHCTFRDVGAAVLATDGIVEITDSLIDIGNTANKSGITMDYSGVGNVASTLRANRVTIVGSGTNQRGILVGADSPLESIDADITDSVIYGSSPDFKSLVTSHANPSGATTVDLVRTAYNVSQASNTGANPIAPVNTGTINLASTAPGFVNPAGRDYRPAAGSVLIDAGTGAGSLAPGALDAFGAPRAVDGNNDGIASSDLGALEFQPGAAPPVLAPVLTPIAKITSRPKKSFPVSKKGGFGTPKKGAASFSVKFTNSAKAKFTIKSIGKKKKLKAVKGSQTVKVKNATVKFGFRGKWNKKKLKAGKYRVSITPLSPAGVSGKAVTVDIKLK